MARRSDHSRDELRALALSTARDLISREGLENVSARRVAREIGYTIGTLYNVFQDFDDLIDHVNSATLDELHMSLVSEEHVLPSPEFLAKAYFSFATANPLLYLALFRHRPPPQGRPPDWYSKKIDGLLRIVSISLHGRAFGVTPDAETMALWASVHGIVSLQITDKFGEGVQASDLLKLLLDRWNVARNADFGGAH